MVHRNCLTYGLIVSALFKVRQTESGQAHLLKTRAHSISYFVLHQLHRVNPPHPNMSRFQDIFNIASITIDTLREIGVEDCCFIGSMACRLYTQGEGRDPKVRYH